MATPPFDVTMAPNAPKGPSPWQPAAIILGEGSGLGRWRLQVEGKRKQYRVRDEEVYTLAPYVFYDITERKGLQRENVRILPWPRGEARLRRPTPETTIPRVLWAGASLLF